MRTARRLPRPRSAREVILVAALVLALAIVAAKMPAFPGEGAGSGNLGFPAVDAPPPAPPATSARVVVLRRPTSNAPAPTSAPTSAPSPAGPPAAVTRGPYLGSPTGSDLRLLWRLDRPAAVELRYGLADGGPMRHVTTTVAATQVVTVTELKAGAEYAYELKELGRAGTLASGTFRASPGPDVPGFRFAVLGDSGTGSAAQEAVAGLLERQRPDLVLHTGDVVYQDGQAEGYGPYFFQPYQRLLARVPFYPTMGNHDYRTANGAPYLDAFLLPANNPQGTERYYSFDYGNAHFTVLDSNQGADPASPMGAWLARDLAATDAAWRFVTFHHAIYSSGPHSDDGYVLPLRQQLAPVLAAKDVDIAFSGHEHLYERSTPRGGGRGVIYVVTGGAGARLYQSRAVEPWTAAFASRHHAVVVDVTGCRLTLRAVDPEGEVFDELALERCD